MRFWQCTRTLCRPDRGSSDVESQVLRLCNGGGNVTIRAVTDFRSLRFSGLPVFASSSAIECSKLWRRSAVVEQPFGSKVAELHRLVGSDTLRSRGRLEPSLACAQHGLDVAWDAASLWPLFSLLTSDSDSCLGTPKVCVSHGLANGPKRCEQSKPSHRAVLVSSSCETMALTCVVSASRCARSSSCKMPTMSDCFCPRLLLPSCILWESKQSPPNQPWHRLACSAICSFVQQWPPPSQSGLASTPRLKNSCSNEHLAVLPAKKGTCPTRNVEKGHCTKQTS